MSPTLTIWLLFGLLFVSHQLEEVVYSIARWNDEHPRPQWKRWTAYVNKSPMASRRLGVRIRTVAMQSVAIGIIALATSHSLLATQISVTIFLVVACGAFVMHLVVSILTRSAMVGLSTSIIPGLPVAIALMLYIWSR